MKAYAKLYCKKTKLRPDGSSPIYLVIKLNGKEKLISTGQFINPDHWDNKAQSASNPAKYNKLMAILNNDKTKLNDVIINIQHRKGVVSFNTIITEFKRGEQDDCFIKFAFNELERLKLGLKMKTHEDYYYSLNNLKEYQSSVTFNEITHEFLTYFDIWLKAIKKRNKTSRNHNFTAIRKFINIAITYGLTNNYPFRTFKIKQTSENKEPKYLTEDELYKLEELLYSKPLGDRHTRTLTNFLFTCYTGIPGQELRAQNSLKISDKAITYTRTKTNQPVLVPLIKKSKRLLPLLKDMQLKQHYHSVNIDLREILNMAGIDKDITYHCGRHTFAVNSLIKGISLSVISNVLGHTTTKTTEIYAKVVDQLLNKEMALWDE